MRRAHKSKPRGLTCNHGTAFYVLETHFGVRGPFASNLQEVAARLKAFQEGRDEKGRSITKGLYHPIFTVAPARWKRTDEYRREEQRRAVQEGRPFARSMLSDEMIYALRGPETIPRKLTSKERLELERLVGNMTLELVR